MTSDSIANPARWLAAFVFTLVVAVLIGILLDRTWLNDIAPQYTGNLSLDQKLLFLSRLPHPEQPLTIVVGSSMALDNVDTGKLQELEGKPFLNLGSWYMNPSATARFTRQFMSLFPVSEVILSIQYFELKDEDRPTFELSDAYFARIVEGKSWLWGAYERDWGESIRLRLKWNKKFLDPHRYTYLGFTNTGETPLKISASDAPAGRWNPTEDMTLACDHCMRSLLDLCHAVRSSGIPFSVVVGPISEWSKAHRPDIVAGWNDRRKRIKAAAAECGARYIDITDMATFPDSCFADLTHLNEGGATNMAVLIHEARFGSAPKERPVESCVFH